MIENNITKQSILANIEYRKIIIQNLETELSTQRMLLTLEENKLQENYDWGMES